MSRTLRHAILLSLALHGVLLFFGLPVERRPALREPPTPRLEARLVEPPAPPPKPLPELKPKVEPEAEPKPALKTPQPRAAKPKPKAKPAPAPVAKPAPKPQPEPESERAARPQPFPPVAAPAPPSVALVDPKPAVPAGPSAEEIEAATREQYRLALINAARRHNRYPRLARENNWEGEVQVSMIVSADGTASLRIKDSSGHPVLDRQAMEMFKRAQAAVPVPAALRGKEFSLELKARYSLKDQVSG